MNDETGIQPGQPNSVEITIEDAWAGGIFCPFCGTETRKIGELEYEARECEHLLCFEQVEGAVFVADRLKKEIEKSGYTVETDGRVVYAIKEGEIGSTMPSSFAHLVPNSITINIFKTNDAIDYVYSYAPPLAWEWKP